MQHKLFRALKQRWKVNDVDDAMEDEKRKKEKIKLSVGFEFVQKSAAWPALSTSSRQ